MENFQLQPEFLNYLCYILIEGESDDVLKQHYCLQDLQNNRATAGMLLKNSFVTSPAFSLSITVCPLFFP